MKLNKKFLKWAKKQPGYAEIVIPMRKCQDVPKFLKMLDRWHKRSAKSKFICK